MDKARPIDVLFYGSENEHRNNMLEVFTRLGSEHGLRIEFAMNYSLFGSHLESAVDQSKV